MNKAEFDALVDALHHERLVLAARWLDDLELMTAAPGQPSIDASARLGNDPDLAALTANLLMHVGRAVGPHVVMDIARTLVSIYAGELGRAFMEADTAKRAAQ